MKNREDLSLPVSQSQWLHLARQGVDGILFTKSTNGRFDGLNGKNLGVNGRNVLLLNVEIK